MPSRVRLLVPVVLALAGAARAADLPGLLLHVPFDGSVDPAFSAFQSLRTTCVAARFVPGKRGKAAVIGSRRFPSALLYRAPRLLNKERGSIAFSYQPLWDPANVSELRRSRVLLTDQTSRLETSRFRLSIEGDRLLLGWPGNPPTLITTPIGGWKKDEWRHILFTWDSGEGVALFVDGVKIESRLVQWSLSPSDTLVFGANRSGMESAEGNLDDLFMYDRALNSDEAEVAAVQPVASRNAPPVAVPTAPKPEPGKQDEPRLTFHCTFDNTVEAKTAAGSGSPIEAKGITYDQGLFGKAVVAREGAVLAYGAEQNLLKERGTMMLWARGLPDPPPGQRVLVADAREAGSDPPQAANGLGLWLQRERTSVLRFGIRPVASTTILGPWDDGHWHHLAVTWERGRHLRVYLNGHVAAQQVGPGTTWQPSPSARLCVGSLAGEGPAHAVIDDLRLYDAPLSPERIAEEARRGVVPMHVELRPHLCERGKACGLTARLFPLGDQELSSVLTWRVLAPDGSEVARLTRPVEIAPDRWVETRISLGADALAQEGAYRVVPMLPGKAGLPEAMLLAVALIPREAPSDGDVKPSLKLQHVGSIEPAALVGAHDRFASRGPARLLRSGDIPYCEAGPSANDRVAFRFALPDSDHPYIAIVSYPDNAARSAGIVMSTPRLPTSHDVATGWLRGDESPTMQVLNLPIHFWPRERQGAFILRTLHDDRPAAVARIALYRVRGALPASSVQVPADGGRRIGLHWDVPLVPGQFGGMGSHPGQVYRSVLRLTDYLRFTGQNLLVYPIVGSQGPLYASPSCRFRGGAAVYGHAPGWLDYVLTLCERRSLRFVPEIRFHDSYALSAGLGTGGDPTPHMALWDDTVSRRAPAELPLYSPVHPAFHRALLAHVDEFLARYGQSPALQGLALHLGQTQSGWFGSIQCGYGDATIAQFEKDTAVKVPVDGALANRFSLRARWLLANQYDTWVAWRCKVVRALHVKVAERLRNANAKLKLYITVATPTATAWQPLFSPQAVNAERSLEQLLREAGVDLASYAAMPNIVLRRVLYPTDEAYLLYRYGSDLGPMRGAESTEDIAYLAESNLPFRSPGGAAVASTYHPFEADVRASGPLPGFWWAPVARRLAQPTPAGRDFLEPYAHAVAALDATDLTAGHSTLVTSGHEPDVHLFARAFRALPAQPFEDIPGLSDPACGRQLRTADAHFVYFVNRTRSPVDLAVGFAGQGVRLLDLATLQPVDLPTAQGKPLPAAMPKGFVSEHTLPAEPGPLPDLRKTQSVSGPLLARTLAPYELVSYRVLGGPSSITYASARVSAKTRLALGQRVTLARQLVARARGDKALIDAARRTLALIDRAWKKHEIRRVELLLDSTPLARLR